MLPWFKIKKHNNTSVNGVDLGQKHKIEVILEEEKIVENKPKISLRKVINVSK